MADQRIYALFQDVADAERAIGALNDRGIPRDHITIVARRPAEQDEAARVRTGYNRLTDTQGMAQNEPETAYAPVPGTIDPVALPGTLGASSTADTAENVETVGKEGLTTTTPQDAAAGAAVGTGIGLVGGLLLGAAALLVPGVGLVLAGGALASAVGVAGATAAAGAVAGGAVGYLRDMGMPEHAAKTVADRLHEGDYLLTLAADSSRYDDIKQLLIKYNAVGVDINVAAIGAVPVSAAVPPPLLSPVVAAPRVPANPALAQETEPMYNFGSIDPRTIPAPHSTATDDALVLEQSRTTERETRDNIT